MDFAGSQRCRRGAPEPIAEPIPRIFALAAIAGLTVLIASLPAQAAPGQVLAETKISALAGAFPDTLQDGAVLGASVISLGDLNDDGVRDIAVGAMGYDGSGPDRGAVWILFLNSDGTISSSQQIDDTHGGFSGGLDDNDTFGSSLAGLGDLDGDGVEDLAVGAFLDDDGDASDQGAVYILFLNTDGTVRAQQKISESSGGFTGSLDTNDGFARFMAPIGDLDGDGVMDLAVGAYLDDDGGSDEGAVWILFLRPDGTVHTTRKISSLSGGFGTGLDPVDRFGAPAGLGDLDGDGIVDIAVGAGADDDGGTNRGAVWVLFMNADGTVRAKQKISDTAGGFTGTLANSDSFGISTGWIGPIEDGLPGALAVGAFYDNDGGVDRGAVWVLTLNTNGTVAGHQKISSTSGGLSGPLADGDCFGNTVSGIGDLDDDGRNDLAVGAYFDDDGGDNRGACWILRLDGDPIPDLPTAPWGGQVSVRATFPARPGEVAVHPNGNIYLGNYYFSGQDADVVPIFRVAPESSVGAGCGDSIPDPDIVLLDEAGLLTTPGNLLVGSLGRFSAVAPDCDSVSVVVSGDPLIGNPQDMAFDGRDRLLFFNFDQHNVVAYDGSAFEEVLTGVDAAFAVDSLDLYSSPLGGPQVVRRHDLDGNLVDPAFTAGWARRVLTIGGHRQLIVERPDVQQLVAVELPSRSERVLLDGFTDYGGIDVDSEGRLYVSQINSRRLIVIEPPLEEVVATPPVAGVGAAALRLSVMPNPSRDGAIVAFSLPGPQVTGVRVFDAAGRLVRDLGRSPRLEGSHSVSWNGTDDAGKPTPSGIYFVEVRAGSARSSTRITRVR